MMERYDSERTDDEGKSIRQTNVPEVQSHQAQGRSHGDLRQSKAQATAGVTGPATVGNLVWRSLELKQYGTY
jgi:hypothetical protein